MTRKQSVKEGVMTGLPIMFGYLPIAITYGVLANQIGMSMGEIVFMSVAVYAGASQFMAVNMIALGTGALEIILATFVLNFRHFILNLSILNTWRPLNLKWKIPLSLGVTDETFAVASMNKERAKEAHAGMFYTALLLVAYVSWVVGSFIGVLLGEVIPPALSQSMGIALYAMFIALLIPSVKKERRVGLIAIVAMFIHFICIQLGMSTGWAIIMGTIFGAGLGIVLFPREEASV
ncbi:AzlC family ABC transporter permease [Oceanobacillus sp. J11TS1]|uniref:AzlC family ABC transporter permease n=1 Tax=Oceanobacillus sp. J11TS1 TaxID=2807191 RepID=UPI001BB3BDA9|nr:AzlC family ABC transporter permease [Oceanobacillus sp. J11TS1]